MHVIKPARIQAFGRQHRRARVSLDLWLVKTKAAEWSSLADTRQTFAHADEVRVDSGRKVTVFNIAGNSFRLIAAIHYNRGKVYVLRFLTHAEYDKDQWKRQL